MKKIIASALTLAMALTATAQSLRLSIQTPDTANLMLYVQPENPSDEGYTRMEYDGKAYTAECAKPSNSFYNITCVKDGGQYNIPLFLASDDVTLSLSFTDGVPMSITPLQMKAKQKLKDVDDKLNTQAINDYYAKSTVILRKIWMNMAQTNAAQIVEYVNQLKECAAEITTRKKVSDNVKSYIGIWAYLDSYNTIDGYNRSHEDHVDGAELLKLAPYEVLDTDVALLHHSAVQVAYINVPKKELINRIKYVREHYKTPAMAKAVEKTVLDNYLRYYRFEIGGERGMKELTETKQAYGIDDKYISQFQERMSAINGAAFPDVLLETPDGKKVDFAQFRGKYVYIDLWASWCVPCVKEIPYLQALEKELQNDKVVFVSISCDTDREAWHKKREALNLHGNQFINADNKLCNQLNVSSIPRFLIYNPDGNLVNANAPRPSSEQTKELLENLK